MEFEWDPEKDLVNQQKHGISFAEAFTVFGDPLHRTAPDPRHSLGEFRYLTPGYTSTNRLVIVAHADRSEKIRIITARDVCRRNGDFMSNEPELEEDDIPEMDLAGGVRGKYYERYRQGTNVVLLEPDMARVFRDSAVVNQALREYLKEHGTPPAVSKQAGYSR